MFQILPRCWMLMDTEGGHSHPYDKHLTDLHRRRLAFLLRLGLFPGTSAGTFGTP